MKKKGDAHETLSLFFKRDGIPPKMVMDGSKDHTIGLFRKNSRGGFPHEANRATLPMAITGLGDY